MKAFTAIATTPPNESTAIKKEDVWGWTPVILAVVAIAVGWGVFKTKLSSLEDKIKKIEDNITKNEESGEKQRNKDIEYVKELLENNNRVLLTEIQSEGRAVKQSLQYMVKLIQNR